MTAQPATVARHRRTYRPLIAVVLSLLGATVLSAAGSPSVAATEGGFGPISGRITASATSEPLQHVLVFVYDSNGVFVTLGSSDAAGDWVTIEEVPAGDYRVYARHQGLFISEVYDNIPCLSDCHLVPGTPVTVVGGSTTAGIDFALEVGGTLAGNVVDEETGDPLVGAEVSIWDHLGRRVAFGFVIPGGGFTTSNGLPTGTYFASTHNQLGFLSEVWDDIPCPFYSTCDRTTGTPIQVIQGAVTSGIDFELARGGAIAGTVTDAITGQPIEGLVVILDESGNHLAYGNIGLAGPGGAYRSDTGLPTGTYYATSLVETLHVNELYDDHACPISCVPTAGAPIAVTVGATTEGIDFKLAQGGAILGFVRDAATGQGLKGARVGIFDHAGTELGFLLSGNGGFYFTSGGAFPGTYLARTLNGRDLGYADQRYLGLPCLPTCPILGATPFVVTLGASTGGIDFALTPRPLFFDGFETGGLGPWSGAAGGTACAHSMCTEGGPIAPGCDPCVATICILAPDCCDTAWDSLCIGRVRTACGVECP